MTFRTDGSYGFYPIFDRAERVRWALDQGIRTLQIRAKDLSGAALEDELAQALAYATEDVQLVVNDHWQLAMRLGARFVHLGQEDLDEADLSALSSAGIHLGLSSHTPGERDRALDAGAAYIALGPVFETTLKAMRFAPQGLERVAAWSKAAGSTPICAIGGLSRSHAPQLRAHGARLIAMVSDLQAADAEARAQAWHQAFHAPVATTSQLPPLPTPQTALYRARRGHTDHLTAFTDTPEALRRELCAGTAVLLTDRVVRHTVPRAALDTRCRTLDAQDLTQDVLHQAAANDDTLVLTGALPAVLHATRRAWNEDVSVLHAVHGLVPADQDWGVPRVI